MLSMIVIVAATSASAGAAPPQQQQQQPGISLPEGPWPPDSILAADPARVPRPSASALSIAAAEVTADCPAAPYGVQHNAPGAGKTVALTFDDGPGKSTGAILSILQSAGTAATFFNLGLNSAVRPADVRSEATLAFALASHTWDHPRMPTLSVSAQAKEMDDAIAEQIALVGRPPCLFRPPYGEYNATTLTLAQQRHMAVWNWSVDTEDWKAGTSTSQDWVERIVSRAEAGASQQHPVILMHNPPAGIPATVAALPRIIDFYRARGYTFVDLFGSTGHGRPGPAVTATAGGGLTLATVGADNALWVKNRAATWSAWRRVGGAINADPALAVTPDGGILLVVRGSDNAGWVNVGNATGTSWRGWQRIGGKLASAPSVTVAGAAAYVFVYGTDGRIWEIVATNPSAGSGWTGWKAMP